MLLVNGFPDGAPSCLRNPSLQPKHKESVTQQLDSLPYFVEAASNEYHPGQQILGITKLWFFS